VPTPSGSIEVEWHGEKGTVTLPPDVSARLADDREVEGPGSFEVRAS